MPGAEVKLPPDGSQSVLPFVPAKDNSRICERLLRVKYPRTRDGNVLICYFTLRVFCLLNSVSTPIPSSFFYFPHHTAKTVPSRYLTGYKNNLIKFLPTSSHCFLNKDQIL